LIPLLDTAATFSEFGLYYFIFGLFAVLGIVMLALVLMAEPDPQYQIDDLPEAVEGAELEEIPKKDEPTRRKTRS
jgi:hypothetical protein